ncbi:MAG: hypothetical protein J0H80_00190, partial [Rhizobiales bacterium]|nr:hypothetical protein [Hyphomicrobiales bacterium]
MNAPIKHASGYWGTKTDFASLLAQVEKIGPILDRNSEANEKLGRLNDETFEALKPLRMSHIFAGEDIGGAQLSPTQGLQLIEAITYRMWLGRPVAEVATAKGTRLFDAATGQALPAPTAREAEEIARLAWRGGARPAAKVERIERASPEYRGTLPAWRVAFADLDSTRVYRLSRAVAVDI